MGTRRPLSTRAAGADLTLAAVARDAGITLDAWQVAAAERLEHLARRLARPARRREPGGGVYLWGPVGRGKTWLLDAFFATVPSDRKKRVHFHSLLRDLHAAVHAHRSAPHAFDAAVDELLADCAVVCFDELHLHDVGDAMLLSRLLHRLLDRGIALVATSNYAPEALLPSPLYHHLFEPGIDLIRRHLAVVEVAGPTDYRAPGRPVRGAGGFRGGALLWPGSPEQLTALARSMPSADRDVAITVGPRAVRALRAEERRVWFDFADLCEGPTSAGDLLALAERFPAWVVSGVPALGTCAAEPQQRFLNLVDVLHDRDVELTLVCDVPPDRLLAGPLLVPDAERAASRLQLLTRRPATMAR